MRAFVRGATPATRDAKLVAGGAAVLAIVLLAFVALELRRSYDAALEGGRARSSNLATLLEEQTRRTVQAIDLSLGSIVDTLRLAPETPSHDPLVTRRLRSRVAELPYVRALFVVGADGYLIQDSDINTPNVTLADRDYFRVHAERADAGLFIGQPLRSRSPGKPWFLSMSRRIALDDGRFLGVAVAALEPKYFARFYADLDVGEDGSIALVHRSGTIVARFPDHERGVGGSIADGRIFTRLLPAAPIGTFVSHSGVDDVERIFSYRALDPLPLVVVVGVSRAAQLADWNEKLALSLAASLVVLLCLTATAFIFLRRRARERLAAERLREVEKIEALAQMTGSVAHDFNNLLAVITGNLEIVDARLPPGDPLRVRVGKTLDATERGARLISQLLAFARREPVEPTPENPAALVEEMDELLRQAVTPCLLAVVSGPDIWRCDLDTGQFERAALNLAVNARDASPMGGTVEVSLRNLPAAEFDRLLWPDLRPGDYVVFRVRDQGEGMPADVIRRACEPFFTTKGEGRGTGLGLSQVFGFARQSGGGLTIESAVGKGTTVTLLLPRSTRPAAATPVDRPAPDLGEVA